MGLGTNYTCPSGSSAPVICIYNMALNESLLIENLFTTDRKV